MISALDFARLALLIVVLAFSVQANERAKRIVRERRIQREHRVTGPAASTPAVRSRVVNDDGALMLEERDGKEISNE